MKHFIQKGFYLLGFLFPALLYAQYKTGGSQEGKLGSGGTEKFQCCRLDASFSYAPVLCGADSVHFTSTVIGRTPPFTYLWSFGNSTTSTNANPVILYAQGGTYTVTVVVTDAIGCTATATQQVVVPQPLVAAITSSTNVSCNGGNNGSATLTASGGTAPYTYLWSNGATTGNLSNLTAGTYNVTVTDANGCTATANATITEPDALQLTLSSTNSTYGNSADGSASLTVNGGTAPYSYLWSNGATTEDLINLVPGTYTVVVTDANGCTANGNVVILPSALPPCNDNWSNSYGNGGTNWPVWSIAVRGNDVFVGGDFTTAGGQSAETVAKWDMSQNNWTDRAIMPLHYFVDEIALSTTNNYISGFFWASPDMTITSLADWRGGANFNAVGDELSWGWWGPYIYGMAVSPNTEALYVGGGIDGTYGGVTLNNIGKYEAGIWTGLAGTSGTVGVNDFVYDVAVSADETVYAGGDFTTAGGITANYIAKWNTTTKWTALGSGTALTGGGVRAIAIKGNDVYVGGFFTAVNGDVNANHIAKWNGTSWVTLGTGINGAVQTIAIADNGDVFVGGSFTLAGGVTVSNIAKWNGTQWEALGSGTNGTVLTLSITGNELFAGGDFSTAGGKVNNNFAHYTSQPCSGGGSFKMADNSVNSTQETHSPKRLSHAPAMNNNTQESKAIYYPNPATHELIVKVSSEGSYELSITNLLGQKVITKRFTGKTVLDVSDIRPKGLYFMQVFKEDGTRISVGKLVIGE